MTLPGKPVPDGLQERPSLGPLGLCVRGVCIRSRFFFFQNVMHVCMHSKMRLCHAVLCIYIVYLCLFYLCRYLLVLD